MGNVITLSRQFGTLGRPLAKEFWIQKSLKELPKKWGWM